MGPVLSRRAALGAAAASLMARGARAATAADTLRVGKAVAENFGYVPLNVGMDRGFFQQHGLEIEELGFTGGAKIAQAMTARSIDISLSAGPDMQFVAKGAPEIAVASITTSPAFMGYCVGTQSTARGLDDLKGKKIGITSPGSLTYWLVDELNRVKGWTGARDRAVQIVVGGSTAASLAAIKTAQVDASLSAAQTGFLLEYQKAGRLLADCSQYVGAIELFTIFASTALTKQNPDAVRRFLAAWYEAVGFMKSHKAETVAIASKVMGYPPVVAGRSYDTFMSKFSTDGRMNPKAITTLQASFSDLKVLDGPVDMTKLYTEQFLPKAGG